MSTRSKYTRVKVAEIDQKEAKPDTDIIMRVSQRYGKYVSRALTLLFGEGKPFVVIKAAERVIDRALWVAEVIRRKVPDLHQIINISERKIVDVYQPREEGLLRVEQERFLSIVEITLTTSPTAEEKKAPGYHPPLPASIANKLLTKDTWLKGEEERAEKRANRAEGRDDPKRRNEERPFQRAPRRDNDYNRNQTGFQRTNDNYDRRNNDRNYEKRNDDRTYDRRNDDRTYDRRNERFNDRDYDRREDRGGERRRGGRRD